MLFLEQMSKREKRFKYVLYSQSNWRCISRSSPFYVWWESQGLMCGNCGVRWKIWSLRTVLLITGAPFWLQEWDIYKGLRTHPDDSSPKWNRLQTSGNKSCPRCLKPDYRVKAQWRSLKDYFLSGKLLCK